MRKSFDTTTTYKKLWDNKEKYNVIMLEGGSRCFAYGTLVRMSDGTLKEIQEIKAGDLVLGSDGISKRTVIETHSGIDEMFLVHQNKGIDYVVNSDHLLCLKQTRGKEKKFAINGFMSSEKREHRILPIPENPNIYQSVSSFFSSSKRYKRLFCGYKQNTIQLTGGKLPIDPYYLGLWIGDGTTVRPYEITNTDQEVLEYLRVFANKKGTRIKNIDRCTWNLIQNKNIKELSATFRVLGLCKKKHIPQCYKTSSLEQRLQLLAGMIDSDGYKTNRRTYVLTQKNKQVTQDFLEVARISGFFSNGIREKIAKMKRADGSMYQCRVYEVEISSPSYIDICKFIKIKRKKIYTLGVREHGNTKIEVYPQGVGMYYGFTLKEHPEFLLEDGTVVHNSGKTWAIIQFLITYCYDKDFRVSCFRKQSTWTRDTIWVDFQANLKHLDIFDRDMLNKSLMECDLGMSHFEFRGLDDIDRTRSRTQDITWINEATDISRDIFDELEQRTNKLFILDYNPIFDQCWLYDLRKRNDVLWLHSTMLDNPFLPQKIIDKIKGYEPTEENEKRGTVDIYKWTVYGLGLPSKREGTVYENWEEKEIPKVAKLIGYGLDFGYTNDPTAFVAMYSYDNDIYLDEIFYETGLTNDDICQKFIDHGISPKSDIIADSAEPKSIEEISRKGYRIMGATKGRDSVNYGIDLLRAKKVYYSARSQNIGKEYRNYIWKQDKEGKSLNVPIDDFNHILDATRYIAMEKLEAPTKRRSIEEKRNEVELLRRRLQQQGLKV